MRDDSELLRQYVEGNEENAFRELVARHLNFVFSAAMRQVNGDAHLAADVTQRVFIDFAGRARSLIGRHSLVGWLFVSTRYTAAKLVRTERRRQAREQEAVIMHEGIETSTALLDWNLIRPVLDEALAKLSESDREAVLMRFFEGRAFAEVGARLCLSENAARMRVDRALDKLRSQLRRSGVSSTAAALGVALASQGVMAAPVGLGATVSAAALASVPVAATAASLVTFMSLSKLQLGIFTALATSGTSIVWWQHNTQAALTREMRALQQVDARNVQPTPLRAESLNGRTVNHADPAVDADLAHLADATEKLQREMASSKAAVLRAADSVPATAPGKDNAAELDRLPRMIKRTPPIYPSEQRIAGKEGRVLVRFVVDAEGKVKGAVAAESSDPAFEAAAIAAVEQWTFEAGRKGGRLVNTQLEQVIMFSVSAGEMPSSNWF